MSGQKRNRSAGVEDYSLIRFAERSQVELALARLNMGNDGGWLSPSNPYAVSASARIRSDSGTVPSATYDQFAEYLAASAFVHCGDAWAYLGRSIDALVRGDESAAIHLAYYAELRGALSLMGSEGIYVGDYYTCALTAGRGVTVVSTKSTHQSIWKCFDAWNHSPRSSAAMGAILRPAGVRLDSWAAAVPNGSIGPMVTDLLDRMNFDLRSFANDRNRRNDASYGPTRVLVDDLPTGLAGRVVTDLWTILEPDAAGTFPILDRLLLLNILSTSYKAVHKVMSDQGEVTEEVDWSNWELWVDRLLPPQALSSALYDALLEVPGEGAAVSQIDAAFAGQDPSDAHKDYVAGMLMRTAILLRISTGACLDLLEGSGLSSVDIDSWVSALGVARGIWPKDDAPEDKLDLWADTQMVLEALADTTSQDTYGILKTMGAVFPVLSQTERVVTWSFS